MTGKLTNLILAGCMMLPVACWTQESMPAPRPGTSGLSPGDQVQVHMYDFSDLGGAVTVHVSPDGTMHLPYAGTLQVSGMSSEQLQEAISQALQTKGIVKSPNVTVDVTSAVGMSVDVIGQVQSPRSIPLYAPAPISFVLSQVGGLSGYALHHLTIIHPQEAPTSLDYDPESPSPATLHTLVQPGDIVHVGSMGVYFVAGEVNRPGIYPIGGAVSIGQVSAQSGVGIVKQMTMLGALTQAGGITAIAARSQMRILRTIDGKREEILVDQVKLYKGEIADPIIHPDDIIYIPSSYIRQVTNNIFSTAVTSLYAATQFKTVTQ